MKLFLKIFFLIPVFSFSQENYFNETPINISLDSINKQIIYQTNKSLFFIDSEKLNILNIVYGFLFNSEKELSSFSAIYFYIKFKRQFKKR